MYLCYVDEAGDVGMLDTSRKDSQPVLAVVGLILPAVNLRGFTREFIQLKRDYCAKEIAFGATIGDVILHEVKGATLRKVFTRNPDRDIKHKTDALLDGLVASISRSGCRIVGRVHVKKPNFPTKSAAIYSASVQTIAKHFQEFLRERGATGAIIADHRNHALNINVAHSIFTQMYKSAGDSYPNIVEMPTFGHSNNHAGLQAADILCSALLYPMAVHAYCLAHSAALGNKHVQPGYRQIREKYCNQLSRLQFRYTCDRVWYDGSPMKIGGIHVSDGMGRRRGGLLFERPAPRAPIVLNPRAGTAGCRVD